MVATKFLLVSPDIYFTNTWFADKGTRLSV